jgi:hypothetical protein
VARATLRIRLDGLSLKDEGCSAAARVLGRVCGTQKGGLKKNGAVIRKSRDINCATMKSESTTVRVNNKEEGKGAAR